MARKHLVLDYDVHLRLQRRKNETGLALHDIGNAILRSVLSQPLLVVDAVRDQLIQSGTCSQEAFQDALRSGIQRINVLARGEQELLSSPGKNGDSASGSWSIHSLYRAPDGGFELFEARARDARKRPTPLHLHDEEESLQVLSGNVLVVDEIHHLLLTSGDCHCVERRHAHSVTPVTKDARVLVTLIPAGLSIGLFPSEAAGTTSGTMYDRPAWSGVHGIPSRSRPVCCNRREGRPRPPFAACDGEWPPANSATLPMASTSR